MNANILILLFLGAVPLVIPENDAWRVSISKAKWVCGMSCKAKVCKWVKDHGRWRHKCRKACKKVCHMVFGKKRDALENAGMSLKPKYLQQDLSSDHWQDTVVIVPHPNEMSLYDQDKDSRVSRDEFIAFYPESDEQGTIETFDTIDKNGDKYMDCDEFIHSELEFSEKPQC